MRCTVRTAAGQQLADVDGIRNAVRLFVLCPDAWAIHSDSWLLIDRAYLYEHGIDQRYEAVLGLLTNPRSSSLDGLFGGYPGACRDAFVRDGYLD